MNSHPSLAVRLMQIAGEFELERKRERQDLEDRLDDLEARNDDIRAQYEEQAIMNEKLRQRLRQTQKELEQAQEHEDEDAMNLQKEVVGLRLLLGKVLANLSDSQTSQLGQQGVPMTMLRTAALDQTEFNDAFAHGDEATIDDMFASTNGQLFLKKYAISDAFISACAGGSVGLVKRLLDLGADVGFQRETDYSLASCIHSAAAAGHDLILKFLITKAGAAIDMVDAQDRTPLHVAAAGDHAGATKLLLLHGVDPNLLDDSQRTAQKVAEAHRSVKALKVLHDTNILFWNCSVRANKLYNLKRYDVAIQAYSQALELAITSKTTTTSRDLATLHYNRARASYRLGQHVSAIEDCTAALDQDDSYRNALAQRAECYMSLFDFDKAVRDFQALLDADPDDRQWARRLLDAQSMRDLTHYEVLGSATNASSSELKKAYRKHCLRWHPDKHVGSSEDQHRSKAVFQRVKQAYEVLTDEYQKVVYDMQIRLQGPGGGRGSSTVFTKWYDRELERERERLREREAFDAEIRKAEQAAQAKRDKMRERIAAAKRQRQAELQLQQQQKQQQQQQQLQQQREMQQQQLRRQYSAIDTGRHNRTSETATTTGSRSAATTPTDGSPSRLIRTGSSQANGSQPRTPPRTQTGGVADTAGVPAHQRATDMPAPAAPAHGSPRTAIRSAANGKHRRETSGSGSAPSVSPLQPTPRSSDGTHPASPLAARQRTPRGGAKTTKTAKAAVDGTGVAHTSTASADTSGLPDFSDFSAELGMDSRTHGRPATAGNRQRTRDGSNHLADHDIMLDTDSEDGMGVDDEEEGRSLSDEEEDDMLGSGEDSDGSEDNLERIMASLNLPSAQGGFGDGLGLDDGFDDEFEEEMARARGLDSGSSTPSGAMRGGIDLRNGGVAGTKTPTFDEEEPSQSSAGTGSGAADPMGAGQSAYERAEAAIRAAMHRSERSGNAPGPATAVPTMGGAYSQTHTGAPAQATDVHFTADDATAARLEAETQEELLREVDRIRKGHSATAFGSSDSRDQTQPPATVHATL